MSSKLYLLSATEAVRQLAAGTISAEELVRSCFERIEETESQIRAWVVVEADVALEQARAIDKRLSRGEVPRKLSGIPVGVKDVFNTVAFPTQMGSPAWAGFMAGNDARAVAALRLEGAIVPGRTVTAEFAVHSPGPTRNPHNVGHTPGTSSSGSVTAVAAGMVPAGLCTQTAGSTIRPSSYCGVYGMKPSFGLIPRTGMLKTTDTLDHVGFCARSVDDIGLILDVLRVRGPNYPVVEARLRDESPTEGPWRVGLVRGPFWPRTEEYAQSALLSFATAIAGEDVKIEDVELPDAFESAYAVHAVIYKACLAYYFREETERKPELVSSRFMEMVERGRRITPLEYSAALEQQVALTSGLETLFDGYDLLLTLSSNGEAPRGEEPPVHYDTCLVWTLCGASALSVPVFVGPRGLPFGAQLVARKYGDLTLISFARHLERSGLIGPAPVVSLSA